MILDLCLSVFICGYVSVLIPQHSTISSAILHSLPKSKDFLHRLAWVRQRQCFIEGSPDENRGTEVESKKCQMNWDIITAVQEADNTPPVTVAFVGSGFEDGPVNGNRYLLGTEGGKNTYRNTASNRFCSCDTQVGRWYIGADVCGRTRATSRIISTCRTIRRWARGVRSSG
jgi:hypothetical protein